jgi:hypothetical protein
VSGVVCSACILPAFCLLCLPACRLRIVPPAGHVNSHLYVFQHGRREQYDKLQSAPGANSLGLAAGDADPAGADPLAAQQVKQQMEALLHEKARLAQENDRLLRENNGLQELLEFTIRQHADVAGEDELFGGGGWEEEEQEFATPEGSGFDRDEDGRFDQQ